ncbi:hypothetical protein GCM10023201_10540 [Actinomycetospora corticicola]|uniref:Uncharacterized protein n=1 Tax=Actinomycetospora corticicola TaxID=663602 RepID=A0A7Y9J4X0_9PSEU|nr:hypothetical protein [Actinomycetospora corticicola]NYD35109.1 hypothetical protein [Actinomycetospora corticicola]
MTLPAYSGRHATFDATTVLPVVPPAGAPPGPPATVTTAVVVLAVQGGFGVLGLGFFGLMAVAFGLGTGDYPGLVACLLLVGAGLAFLTGWFLLALRIRTGSRGARVVVALVSAIGLAGAATSAALVWPSLITIGSAALQASVLVLLFVPSSNAWFRAVSPAPGPGSPRR